MCCRYFGQNLLLHDCLYRSRGLFTFTAVMDMDENIVPAQVHTGNWLTML